MAIDDPVEIAIRQAQEESEASSSLAVRLTKLGISGVAAASFSQMPFIAQVLTSLLDSSATRFEERLLKVCAELHLQQKRIEDKIPDMNYYTSEPFGALFTLILERLHATRHEEKLRMFGDSLANSGSSDFQADDTEQYIRTLRDRSLEDLRMLQRTASLKKRPEAFAQLRFTNVEKPSLARLTALGLINESHKLRDFKLSIPVIPTSSQSVDRYARGMVDAFGNYLQQAPMTVYEISDFGERFLRFIANDTDYVYG
jgi:hypothetical protein